MKKQLFSLALWMFFGFVLVKAIDSVLKFIVNAYFNLGLWQEWHVDFLLYSIILLSILLYSITSILIIRFLQREYKSFQIENVKLPISLFTLSIIISIFLNPLQYKLSGLIFEKVFSREPEPYGNMEFVEIYGTMTFILETCSWVAIIILSIYLYRIYKKNEIETEK